VAAQLHRRGFAGNLGSQSKSGHIHAALSAIRYSLQAAFSPVVILGFLRAVVAIVFSSSMRALTLAVRIASCSTSVS